MMNPNETLKDCTVRLHMLMGLSDVAFSNYLTDKFYLHALCIKKNNEAVYDFIIEHAHIWPRELESDFISLLDHYDIWFNQFEQFERKQKFELNEPFVFYHLDDKSAYPKQSVAKINALYQLLTG